MHPAIHDRFCKFIRDWLKGLPRGGWAGSGAELRAVLEAALEFHPLRFGVRVPMNIAAAISRIEPAIEAAGWQLCFSRTKSERLVGFVKLKRGKK